MKEIEFEINDYVAMAIIVFVIPMLVFIVLESTVFNENWKVLYHEVLLDLLTYILSVSVFTVAFLVIDKIKGKK